MKLDDGHRHTYGQQTVAPAKISNLGGLSKARRVREIDNGIAVPMTAR